MSIRRIFPIPSRIRHQPLIQRMIRRTRQALTRQTHLLNLLRRNWKMVPKMVKDCVAWALVGHVLTYVPYIIHKIAPKWTYENVDWFIRSSFHFSRPRYWYFKDTAENILYLITYYILAKVSAKFSDILFIAFLVFFGYHVVDTILYWWDFNSEFDLYVDLLWTMIVLINVAGYPYDPEKIGRIKSLF